MASIHASVRARLAVTPIWAWVGFVLLASAGVLVWHEWANREQAHEEAAWLDPEQPLPNLDQVTQQAPPATRARTRAYPPTLADWPHSKVGNC